VVLLLELIQLVVKAGVVQDGILPCLHNQFKAVAAGVNALAILDGPEQASELIFSRLGRVNLNFEPLH
jgi:acetylglutamate kinase